MRPLLGLLVAAALAAGCAGVGGDDTAAPDAAAPPASAPRAASAAPSAPAIVRSWNAVEPPPPAPGCTPGSEEPMGTRRQAFAALTRTDSTVAYRRPGGRAVETFGPVNVNGFDTVFGVLGVVRDADCEPSWYRVQLPLRPNGAVGYVRARAVDLVAVRTRIEIDISERRLDFLRNGKLVRRLTAAVGAPGTPTPTGRYYINQRIIAGNPEGPWGPAALGISAFSPTLVHWTQGGPIAIHGTNDPASIGRAASNGCLRLPNAELERLYEQTPAGTPVIIRA